MTTIIFMPFLTLIILFLIVLILSRILATHTWISLVCAIFQGVRILAIALLMLLMIVIVVWITLLESQLSHEVDLIIFRNDLFLSLL